MQQGNRTQWLGTVLPRKLHSSIVVAVAMMNDWPASMVVALGVQFDLT